LAIIVLNLQNWHNGTRPDGWELKVNHGQADVSECVEGNDPCLHLKSERSSFGLERSVDIDPNQTGDLAWTWKVAQLPNGGDFRRTATDDQAAQVLVAFADHRVLAYIWDSTAPKGIIQSASSLPLIHIYAVVCESGAADANRWISESRDVAADYQRAFGKPAPHVKGLRIQINSQHTGTVAESYFREVVFRSKPQ
jgi:hypothetical protein